MDCNADHSTGGGVKVEPSDIAEEVRRMGREDYLAGEMAETEKEM